MVGNICQDLIYNLINIINLLEEILLEIFNKIGQGMMETINNMINNIGLRDIMIKMNE